MGRRDYGSGRIAEVGPGRYRLRVSAGKDLATGKRRIVTETFTGTKKAGQQRLAELVAEHGRRGPGTNVTLRYIIDQWLDDTDHAHQTRDNYDRARSRIPPALLGAPASRITSVDIHALYRTTTRTHGPHATHYMHALVSGAYTNARRMRWVHDHPARDAVLPHIGKRVKTTPQQQMVLRILAAAADEQQALWLRIVAVTGRRRSEVLALNWSDIDHDAAVVHVTKAFGSGGTLKRTKTQDQAQIALDARTLEQVVLWQQAQRERAATAGVELVDDPWLFSDDPTSARPWRRDLASRRFAATRARAGVPAHIRLNDMRHANVTLLVSSGVDPRTVAGRVGHDPAMSLGTYSAIVDEANRAAADTIANALDHG